MIVAFALSLLLLGPASVESYSSVAGFPSNRKELEKNDRRPDKKDKKAGKEKVHGDDVVVLAPVSPVVETPDDGTKPSGGGLQGAQAKINIFPFCYKIGTSFIGNNLQIIEGVTSMDECAKKCKSYAKHECKYAKLNTYTNECKLQDKHTMTVGGHYFISYSVKCGRCFAPNQIYANPTAETTEQNIGDCKAACKEGCEFYSYDPVAKNCRTHKTVDYYNPILHPDAITQTKGCNQAWTKKGLELKDDDFIDGDTGDTGDTMEVDTRRGIVDYYEPKLTGSVLVGVNLLMIIAAMAGFVYCKNAAFRVDLAEEEKGLLVY